MKMVYSRQNDFRLLNRIAKGDTLVVKAYGWDKKPFFKQEVSGLHTIKEAIGLVRANNSAEIVWVSVYNKTTDYKAVFSPNFDFGYQKSLLLRMEKYGQKHNIDDMLVSVQKARQMGFFTESMCTDVRVQNKYLRLIKTYSQSFFDIWNYEKPSFEV